MKLATTSADYRDSQESLHRASRSRVRKISKERREQAKTLDKLRLMVGSDEHCSQLEIIQRVIDYICYLRRKLNESEQPEDDATMELLPQLVAQLTATLKSR
ncbi:hypothetical protein AAVH_07771 [Aphelenchoides avenae]|nr:hypothetical protein AAVH_07771 [Aphelenchus avenae]